MHKEKNSGEFWFTTNKKLSFALERKFFLAPLDFFFCRIASDVSAKQKVFWFGCVFGLGLCGVLFVGNLRIGKLTDRFFSCHLLLEDLQRSSC